MKRLHVLTATLALGLLTAAPTLASDRMRTATGSGGMMMSSDMSEGDRYKWRWSWYHLDDREMKRYKAAGYDEETIRAAANIALKTGLSLDYVLRRLQTTGVPVDVLALQWGVPADDLDDDIPGMGSMG